MREKTTSMAVLVAVIIAVLGVVSLFDQDVKKMVEMMVKVMAETDIIALALFVLFGLSIVLTAIETFVSMFKKSNDGKNRIETLN